MATRLHELLAAWKPPKLTPEIPETARMLLLADGDEEPPCGWDEFTLQPDFHYEKFSLRPDGFNEG